MMCLIKQMLRLHGVLLNYADVTSS